MTGESRQTVFTRNVSLGGMLVETLEPLAPQTRVQIRFTIPSQREPVEVQGEVRWVEKQKNLASMGIRFHGLRAREVWALNRFFQTPA